MADANEAAGLARHLGDGVYVEYDGYVFWLSTREGMRIRLSASVVRALRRYAEQFQTCWARSPDLERGPANQRRTVDMVPPDSAAYGSSPEARRSQA